MFAALGQLLMAQDHALHIKWTSGEDAGRLAKSLAKTQVERYNKWIRAQHNEGAHMHKKEQVYDSKKVDVSAFENADAAAPNGDTKLFFQTLVFQPCTKRNQAQRGYLPRVTATDVCFGSAIGSQMHTVDISTNREISTQTSSLSFDNETRELADTHCQARYEFYGEVVHSSDCRDVKDAHRALWGAFEQLGGKFKGILDIL